MTVELNKIYVENCLDTMARMPDNFLDLTVTSPPYDDLRDYKGFTFDFLNVAIELFRITKKGGVVVWVVGDKIKKGNKSLTSFRQAIKFQEIGFNVHDVMIYQKKNTPFMRLNAYTNAYELMIILSKGTPKTFNPIKEKSKRSGVELLVTNKGPDGINRKVPRELKKEKTRTNIWDYAVGLHGSTSDKNAFKHPAIFPEKLANDHIISWSNEGDLVYDPFIGSGTTAKMAILNNRNFIGSEISQEYAQIARERLKINK
jgi:site-specific DNA-methyltransferase (adenine-specific)